jgi:isopentenyldiphosphate isomerase
MQRAADKSFFPLKWGISASGMVDEGESYTENIIKEAREELGVVLREDELIRGERRFMRTKYIPYFYQTFFARRDIPIEDLVFQPHEVETARWMSVPDIAKWFSERPDDFFPTFERGLKNIEGFVKSQEAA